MESKEEIRDIIVRRSRDEQNGKVPEDFGHSYEMTNPLCGDHVKVYLSIRGGKVADLGYHSSGCTLCAASSSFMKEEISFLEMDEAVKKIQTFEKHLKMRETSAWPDEIVNLKYFEHVKRNPSRQMCVFLPWATLRGALKQGEKGNRD